MLRSRQMARLVGWAACASGLVCSAAADGGTAARDAPALKPTAIPPLPPSPVAYFRQLLAASPEERAKTLAAKSESQRQFLEAKLREYTSLEPDERELRLRATELSWYLRPLMEVARTNRSEQLRLIPEDYRSLAEERLRQWDELTPQAQKDLLEYEATLSWFVRTQSATRDQQEAARASLSPQHRERLDQQLARWQALPGDRRQRMCDQFAQFFELSPKQQAKTLNTLSEQERQEMEATLRAFEKLAPPQRRMCLVSFQKFAGLPAQERAEFLKSADRWREMSPAERETWRKLVARMPPLPPGFGEPPMPPRPARSTVLTPPPPSLATNHAR